MTKPNIVLITTDQQHFNTIGAFNSEIDTPNLDRLVKEGTTFKRAYCPNPTCTPTRASILTGLYPSQHGAWTLGTKLDESVPTLTKYLTEEKYITSLIGKAHFQPLKMTNEYESIESYPLLSDLEFWKEYDGDFYGFDNVELARNHTNEHLVGQHYALWLEQKGCENWRDYFLGPTGNMNPNIKYTWDIPEEFHYNTWIAERTNDLLEKHKENNESFFIWSSFFDPHPPYLVPKPWDKMYENRSLTVPRVSKGEHRSNPPHFQKTQEKHPDYSYLRETGHDIHGYHSHNVFTEEEARKNMEIYYGMISMLDKYVGKILDKIDELNLVEDTIIIFTSDHGHFYGQHGLHFKGGFHYEDLLKVPFIVRYPGKVNKGEISYSLQSLVDLAPTILDFIKGSYPYHMTGISQKDVWLGKTIKKRDHVICEFRHEPTTIHQKTYIDDRYKLTVYYNQGYGELFDLQEDPNELMNRWDDLEYYDIKMELLLKYISAELGKEQLAMPRISHA